MSIGNWITIGMALIIGYGTLRVYFNDLKHMKDDIKDLTIRVDKNFDKMWKKLEENAERISKLEGRLNGRRNARD